MPATRSRTENWRQCLQNLYERGGTLELSLPGHERGSADGDGSSGADLIWRVRILELTEREIVVEQPAFLGQSFNLADQIELVGILVIGQNRWMFRTRNLGACSVPGFNRRPVVGYRLVLPEQVERCQRRNFYRVSTVGLILPRVECYPLLRPETAMMAESVNRCDILRLQESPTVGCAEVGALSAALPEVGPQFHAVLVNVGGGGVGIMVDHEDHPALDVGKLFWLRIGLMPHVPIPLGATARVRHTHIDSTMRKYVGMAFEFAWNPGHQRFLVEQVCHYVAQVQREQLEGGGAGAATGER